MSIIVDLQPEIERGLLAQAHARGISLADYVKEIVAREAKTPEPSTIADDRPAGTLVQRGQFLVIEGRIPTGYDIVAAIREERAAREWKALGCEVVFRSPAIAGSDSDPLDFADADAVFARAIEAGGLGAGVPGHALGNLDAPAVGEVIGNAGGAKGVAADPGVDAGVESPAAHHAPHIAARHWPVRKPAGPADRGAE